MSWEVRSVLFRNCAGGVVFHKEKVFLLKNDKEEWTLPKGIVRGEMLSSEVALRRVKVECGIDAEIVAIAGETSYEFYSQTRKQPVCNEIMWYVMTTPSDRYEVNKGEGFVDGGYFTVDEALRNVTYTQDKTLVKQSYAKLKKLRG